MGTSRRQVLAASAAALGLAACGGGTDTREGGMRWTVASRGDGGYFWSVTHGNAVFVAQGTRTPGPDQVVTRSMSSSSDGVSWFTTALPFSGDSEFDQVVGLAFGAGRFVAVSAQGEMFGSTDGRDWAPVAFGANDGDQIEFMAVTQGNGRFVATGAVNGVNTTWSSLDGLSWSAPVPAGIGFVLAPIRFVDSVLYAFIAASKIWLQAKSDDSGLTWSMTDFTVDGRSANVVNLAFGAGTYVALTIEGDVLTSVDLQHWTRQSLRLEGNDVTSLRFDNGLFVAARGRTIATSENGIRWSSTPVGLPGDLVYSLAFDGARFVAAGRDGVVLFGTGG